MDPLHQIAHSMQSAGVTAQGTPKYMSLYNQILASIEGGGWKPGEKLPPEMEIARVIPVSLGTVQKALRMLADHGFVVRRHGHGTFVAGGAAVSHEVRYFRFLSDDGKSMLPLYSRVLSIERSEEKGPWSDFLEGENGLVRISRLVNINLEFQAYCELFLPMSRFSLFLEVPPRELDGASVSHLMGKQLNAPTLRATHRIRSALLPPHICELIGVPARTSGLRWEMFGYSFRDTPISYQFVFIPPNNRQLELRDLPG